MKKTIGWAMGIGAAALLATGCGAERPAPAGDAAVAPEVEAVFTAPPGSEAPTPIPQARTRVKPGEPVVLQGKIMGVMTPFVEGRAAFVLGDEATLTACNLRPGDGCPTPWDVCCDDPAVIRAGTATIQIVGGDGAVLRRGLKGVHGLKELSRVRIEGVADAMSTPEAMIVNARSIVLLP
jgi:hypothetical protein